MIARPRGVFAGGLVCLAALLGPALLGLGLAHAQSAAPAAPADPAPPVSSAPADAAPTTAPAPTVAPTPSVDPAPVAGAAPPTTAVPAPGAVADSEPKTPGRAGLVLGLSLGFGLGRGSGYPNDAKYIDNEDYRGATGLMPGYGWNLFVLGAITREINVGFWGGTSAFENSNWKSRASGGGFRLEAFPFGSLLAALKNTAVYTNLGIGSTKSELKKEGNYAPLAGTQSFVGIGVFHELHITQRFVLAPDARYEAVISRAGAHSAFIVGLRLALYTSE